MQNKKPVEKVNYAAEILLINKKIDKLIVDNKNPVKQTDYSNQISKVSIKVDELNKLITSKTEVKKEVKHVDHSKELIIINKDIAALNKRINKKQDIDIKSEVEKVVTIAYVTNLYRNK